MILEPGLCVSDGGMAFHSSREEGATTRDWGWKARPAQSCAMRTPESESTRQRRGLRDRDDSGVMHLHMHVECIVFRGIHFDALLRLSGTGNIDCSETIRYVCLERKSDRYQRRIAIDCAFGVGAQNPAPC